jgi:hypothetical protein
MCFKIKINKAIDRDIKKEEGRRRRINYTRSFYTF